MTLTTHANDRDVPAVAVVGGGVIGCAVARSLAPDHEVTVFERRSLACGATGLAAGEITVVPSYTDHPAVGSYTIDFFREYSGNRDIEFVECPSLELVPPEREGEARRRAARLSGDGYNVSFLEAAEVKRQFPEFDLDAFVGAVRQGDTGYLDPHDLTLSFADDAREHGGTFRTNEGVDELLVEDGRVVGVETTDGKRHCAELVVVAAGWRSRRFLSDHLSLPVRPYRTHCAILEVDDSRLAIDDQFPSSWGPVPRSMVWLPEEHLYCRPDSADTLLVGGCSEPVGDPDLARSDAATEAFLERVATAVPRFLSSFEEASVVDSWTGVDSATPDTRPIVDAPRETPAGLIVATGFHGRGIMTAPVAARLVRALVVGESPPFPTEPFELDRFDDRSSDFPFLSVSGGD